MYSVEVTVKVAHKGETFTSTSEITNETVVGWSRVPEVMQEEIDRCVASAAKQALGNVGKQLMCAEVKGDIGKG